MALPVSIPNTFANATTSIPLSQLDTNFSTLANVVNGINSGAETLANLKASNVTITGGTISNVTLDNVTVQTESFDNVTMSNVTITSGNATLTNVTATQANLTTANVTNLQSGNVTITSGNVTVSFANAANFQSANVTITGGTMTNVANVAYLNVDQSFSGAQRGDVTTDNDGSFDMAAGNNFQCTPNAATTITFTNIAAGQSGYVLLINTGAHTMSANTSVVKVQTGALTGISANGTYLLNYFAANTSVVYLTQSGALA